MSVVETESPASLRSAYERDGYVVIRQFLPARDFAKLTSELDRYVREVVPKLPDGDAFYHDKSRPETLKQMARLENDPFFAEYLKHPKWRETAEAILGEPVICQGSEWFNKPPATDHATPPHQDNFYFCFKPPQVLTMWLALDVVDEENGCLRYVRGSHAKGLRPHSRTKTLGFSQGMTDFGESDRADEMAIHARPNDVLIHHGNTIHRADANKSAIRHRRSFALIFRGVSAERDTTLYQRYLDSSKAQQQELGLKV